ncbi:MAG: hypothetical protein RR400_02900, partial [Clostridia bacterium]
MIKTIIRFKKDFTLVYSKHEKAIGEFRCLDDIRRPNGFNEKCELGVSPYLQRSYSNNMDNIPLELIKATIDNISSIMIFADEESLIIGQSKIHPQIKQLKEIIASYYISLIIDEKVSHELLVRILPKKINESFTIDEFESYIEFKARLINMAGLLEADNGQDAEIFENLSKQIRDKNHELMKEMIMHCGISNIATDENISVCK